MDEKGAANGLLGAWRFLTSSEVGTLASVVGVALTVWVMVNVRAIRQHFLFIARVPQLLEDLEANASALSKGLAEYDNSTELVDLEMARCKANLGSLQAKLRGKTKKTVRNVMHSVDAYMNRQRRSKESAREIYMHLNGLIQELRNLREDVKWSDANG